VLGILNQGTEITRQVVSERRLSFQVQVADRLRSLGQAGEVKSAAAAMLGEYLGADRVGFVEVDEERGGYTVSTDGDRRPMCPRWRAAQAGCRAPTVGHHVPEGR
jgi:GAF domain-containing protein